MVRKRDDGRWEGRIVIGHKKNGDSIFRYLYADTQKELTAKLRQSIDAYQGVELTEQSRMTLSEWLDQWLDRRMAGTVRGDTLDGYRRDLDNHVKPRLGQKQLTKISPADLKDLYAYLLEHGRLSKGRDNGRGLAPATVRGIHTTLHHALKTAVEEGLLPANPTDEVTPPKLPRNPKGHSQQRPAGCADGGNPSGSALARLLLYGADHRPAAGRTVRPEMEGL